MLEVLEEAHHIVLVGMLARELRELPAECFVNPASSQRERYVLALVEAMKARLWENIPGETAEMSLPKSHIQPGFRLRKLTDLMDRIRPAGVHFGHSGVPVLGGLSAEPVVVIPIIECETSRI